MSELKVNVISGLGGTVKINGQVGLPTVVGTNKLTVDGTIRAEGSIEVVTVSAQTYGVKVKGPQSPATGDSIIKFTNYSDAERAAILAKDNNSLSIKTNGTERFSIDNTGAVTHLFKTVLVGDTAIGGNLGVTGDVLVNGKIKASVWGPGYISPAAYIQNSTPTSGLGFPNGTVWYVV
jgi:hypothetical protein